MFAKNAVKRVSKISNHCEELHKLVEKAKEGTITEMDSLEVEINYLATKRQKLNDTLEHIKAYEKELEGIKCLMQENQ